MTEFETKALTWDELLELREGILDAEKREQVGDVEFVERAYEARKTFGVWDADEPVAQALLALIEAQNTLAAATDAEGYDTVGAPSIEEAALARAKAAEVLIQVFAYSWEPWRPRGWQWPKEPELDLNA